MEREGWEKYHYLMNSEGAEWEFSPSLLHGFLDGSVD